MSFIKVLIFIFTVPLLITFWLFPPWYKVELGSSISDELIYVADKEIVRPSFKTIIADAIQVTLNLRWYDIYIVNKSFLENTPTCLELEQPVLRVVFKEGSPEKYSKTSLDSYDESIYEVPFGSRASFTYSGTDGFMLKMASAWGGKCLEGTSSELGKSIQFDYDIYASPNVRAWFIKFIFIFIFWIFFFSSVLAILRFCQKNESEKK